MAVHFNSPDGKTERADQGRMLSLQRDNISSGLKEPSLFL